MKVYLAGAIDFVSGPKAIGWRMVATETLKEEGIEVLDPTADKDFGRHYEPEEVVEPDFDMIAEADVILAEMRQDDIPYVGTSMEIREFYRSGKPVIAWGMPQGHFIAYHAFRFDELTDALEFIANNKSILKRTTMDQQESLLVDILGGLDDYLTTSDPTVIDDYLTISDPTVIDDDPDEPDEEWEKVPSFITELFKDELELESEEDSLMSSMGEILAEMADSPERHFSGEDDMPPILALLKRGSRRKNLRCNDCKLEECIWGKE